MIILIKFVKTKIMQGYPKLLYHYTNLDALINGIINRNDNEKICLWASKAEYLNDPTEKKTGIRIGQQLIDQFVIGNGKHPFGCEVEKKKNRNLFFSNLCQPYITSFTENKDSIPMWNMYGGNGCGVNLGFATNKIIENNYLTQCLYDSPTSRKIAFDRLCEIDKQNKTLTGYIHFFIDMIIGYKNQSYAHEKEWRSYKMDQTQITENFDGEKPKTQDVYYDDLVIGEVHYRCKNGMIIPYKKIYLPIEALKEIIIGPVPDFELTKQSLIHFLSTYKIDIKGINITKSKVPYRG